LDIPEVSVFINCISGNEHVGLKIWPGFM